MNNSEDPEDIKEAPESDEQMESEPTSPNDPMCIRVHDYHVEPYGKSALAYFCKEETEKQYNIREPPNLLSIRMIMHLFIIGFLSVIYFAVLLYWLLNLRNASFRMDIIWDSFGTRDGNITFTGFDEQQQMKLYVHMIIFSIVYVVILPLIFFFNTIKIRLSGCMNWILKAAAFGIFFGGWHQIKGMTYRQQGISLHQHKIFCICSSILFTLYFTATAVQLVGYHFHRIFRIRLLGYFLRGMISDYFADVLSLLIYAFGYVSLLSGVTAYLSLAGIERKMQVYDELDETSQDEEGWYLRVLYLIPTLLLIAMLATGFLRHNLNEHTHSITVKQFEENLLQFYVEPETDSRDTKKTLSNIFVPVRRR